jgi:hypothetical protein
MLVRRTYVIASVPLLLMLMLLLLHVCDIHQAGVSPRGMPPPMSPSQRAVGVDPGSSLREFVNTGGGGAAGSSTCVVT